MHARRFAVASAVVATGFASVLPAQRATGAETPVSLARPQATSTPPHGGHPTATPTDDGHPTATPTHGGHATATPTHTGGHPTATDPHGDPPTATSAHGEHPTATPTHGAGHPTATDPHGAPTATPAHGGHPTRTVAPTHEHPPHPTATPPHAGDVPLDTTFEQSLNYPSDGLANPWSDVDLQVTLEAPQGREVRTTGFYYGAGEWRFRFAPSEAGQWTWTAVMRRGDSGPAPLQELQRWTGAFRAVRSTEPGFLRVDDGDPARLVFENGTAFPALGIGDCMFDSDGSGTPHDNNWGLDGGFRPNGHDGPGAQFTDLATYARAYGRDGAGFNLFRWSVDNCSFKLWDAIAPDGNRYLEREGRWGDELVGEMKRNGFHIYMAVFGFEPPFRDDPQSSEYAAIRDYLEYVVARYGADVDVWELMNEASASDEWLATVAGMLRAADPYDHPISTSWQRPDHPAIEVVSPHWYELEDELVSDARTAAQISAYRVRGKPVIFGEQGNSVQNWDERSAIRMRLRAWTAFFQRGALIFWNSSYAMDNRGGAANLYIGPEERAFVRVLQEYAGAVGPRAQLFTPVAAAQVGQLRAYGLTEAGYAYVYLVHADTHSANTRATLTLDVPADGRALWIDPATGTVLASQRLGPGNAELQSPPFAIDIALRVEPAGKTAWLPVLQTTQ